MGHGIIQLPCVAGLAQWCPATIQKIDPGMPGQFNNKAREHTHNFTHTHTCKPAPSPILWYLRRQPFMWESKEHER